PRRHEDRVLAVQARQCLCVLISDCVVKGLSDLVDFGDGHVLLLSGRRTKACAAADAAHPTTTDGCGQMTRSRARRTVAPGARAPVGSSTVVPPVRAAALVAFLSRLNTTEPPLWSMVAVSCGVHDCVVEIVELSLLTTSVSLLHSLVADL